MVFNWNPASNLQYRKGRNVINISTQKYLLNYEKLNNVGMITEEKK